MFNIIFNQSAAGSVLIYIYALLWNALLCVKSRVHLIENWIIPDKWYRMLNSEYKNKTEQFTFIYNYANDCQITWLCLNIIRQKKEYFIQCNLDRYLS